MLIKLIIVLLLLFIIISLFTALYRLNKDPGDSTRVVKALAVRVGLSILVFVLVLIATELGWIQPSSVRPY